MRGVNRVLTGGDGERRDGRLGDCLGDRGIACVVSVKGNILLYGTLYSSLSPGMARRVSESVIFRVAADEI
jgi:hypothetical protein